MTKQPPPTKQEWQFMAWFIGILFVIFWLSFSIADEIERLPETAGEAWARFERAYEENR